MCIAGGGGDGRNGGAYRPSAATYTPDGCRLSGRTRSGGWAEVASLEPCLQSFRRHGHAQPRSLSILSTPSQGPERRCASSKRARGGGMTGSRGRSKQCPRPLTIYRETSRPKPPTRLVLHGISLVVARRHRAQTPGCTPVRLPGCGVAYGGTDTAERAGREEQSDQTCRRPSMAACSRASGRMRASVQLAGPFTGPLP